MLKTQVVKVTPHLAEQWLLKNVKNARSLKPSIVEQYAAALSAGEWKLSHLGIAFDLNGNLQDGQHRLTAIVQTGVSVDMMVTWGLPVETSLVIDQGAKRTAADVLHVSTSLAAVARFLASIEDRNKKVGFSVQHLRPIVDAISEVHAYLIGDTRVARRVWSSSPLQTAAVLKIFDGEDPEWVRMVYTALVRQDFDAMPTVAQAFVRQAGFNPAVRGANGLDFFARSLIVFTKAQSDVRKIQVKTTETALVYGQRVIAQHVRGGKPTSARSQTKPEPKAEVKLKPPLFVPSRSVNIV